jgi:hypothetical protein
MDKPKLKEIRGVEIFAAGQWNGDTYSVSDLDEMVKAFDETGKTYRPALKLGHDDQQSLLQRDGLPAAGWISAVYRKGQKLLADFAEIPQKVYDLLKIGAYKRVSSEIYWNANVDGKLYSRLLGAVALLGADLPGVTCLSDIFQMYKKDVGELHGYDLDLKRFTIEIDKSDLQEKGELEMDKEKELSAQIEAEKQKNHTLEQSVSEKDKEIADLKKFKAEQEAKAIELEQKAAQAELEKEVTELVSEKLVTPAMKPYVLQILGTEKKEYSVGDAKDQKKFSKTGLLKEILKLHSATQSTVNTEEGSVEGKVEIGLKDDDKALIEKVEKYAKDNSVSFKVAYKTVMKEILDSEESSDEETEVVA